MSFEEKEKQISFFVEEVQDGFGYCYNCQPYEDGEPFWVLGDQGDLEDVLREVGVPDELRDEVSCRIVCPNCATQLERGAEIAYKSASELALEAKLDEWESLHKDELVNFENHLRNTPSLALSHPMGVKIQAIIKDFPKTTVDNEIWFRGRSIYPGKIFTIEDMKPPNADDIDIPEGRFNFAGRRCCYLAQNEMGAIREVAKLPDEEVFVAAVLVKKIDNILDVSVETGMEDIGLPVIATGLLYSRTLEKRVEKEKGFRKEYLVSQFIADLAKQAGFKGIKFNSSKHYGNNLVIFNPDDTNLEYSDRLRKMKNIVEEDPGF